MKKHRPKNELFALLKEETPSLDSEDPNAEELSAIE